MSTPSITQAELAVMNLLWEHGELTAREIREALYPEGTASQHGTVQKLLQRLEDKLCVERDRSQFVHRFRALISREEYAGSQIEALADKLTAGSLVPILTHLVESRKISREERDAIRRLLEEDAKTRNGGRS